MTYFEIFAAVIASMMSNINTKSLIGEMNKLISDPELRKVIDNIQEMDDFYNIAQGKALRKLDDKQMLSRIIYRVVSQNPGAYIRGGYNGLFADIANEIILFRDEEETRACDWLREHGDMKKFRARNEFAIVSGIMEKNPKFQKMSERFVEDSKEISAKETEMAPIIKKALSTAFKNYEGDKLSAMFWADNESSEALPKTKEEKYEGECSGKCDIPIEDDTFFDFTKDINNLVMRLNKTDIYALSKRAEIQAEIDSILDFVEAHPELKFAESEALSAELAKRAARRRIHDIDSLGLTDEERKEYISKTKEAAKGERTPAQKAVDKMAEEFKDQLEIAVTIKVTADLKNDDAARIKEFVTTPAPRYVAIDCGSHENSAKYIRGIKEANIITPVMSGADFAKAAAEYRQAENDQFDRDTARLFAQVKKCEEEVVNFQIDLRSKPISKDLFEEKAVKDLRTARSALAAHLREGKKY